LCVSVTGERIGESWTRVGDAEKGSGNTRKRRNRVDWWYLPLKESQIMGWRRCAGACSTRKAPPAGPSTPGLRTQCSLNKIMAPFGRHPRHIYTHLLFALPNARGRVWCTHTHRHGGLPPLFFFALTSLPPSRPSCLAAGAPPGPGRIPCGSGRSSSFPTPMCGLCCVDVIRVCFQTTTRGR